MSGVHVSPLGSTQDFVLQQFLMQEAEKSLLHQKIAVFTALASSNDNKQLVNQILETFNRLVALTYGSELIHTKPLNELTMQEEYDQFRNVHPQFKIDKETGKLTISGLEIPATPVRKKKK